MILAISRHHPKWYKLDKIVADLNKIIDLKEPSRSKNQSWIERTKSALEDSKGGTDDFTDRVCQCLLHLPKGLSFTVSKVTHTAYVKITETESEK